MSAAGLLGPNLVNLTFPQVARLMRRAEPARDPRRAERHLQHHHVRRRHRGAVRAQPLSGQCRLPTTSLLGLMNSQVLITCEKDFL